MVAVTITARLVLSVSRYHTPKVLYINYKESGDIMQVPTYQRQVGMANTPAANITNMQAGQINPNIPAGAAGIDQGVLQNMAAQAMQMQQTIDTAKVFGAINDFNGVMDTYFTDNEHAQGLNIAGFKDKMVNYGNGKLKTMYDSLDNDAQRVQFMQNVAPKTRAMYERAHSIEKQRLQQTANEGIAVDINNTINTMKSIPAINYKDGNPAGLTNEYKDQINSLIYKVEALSRANGWYDKNEQMQPQGIEVLGKVLGEAAESSVTQLLTDGDTEASRHLLKVFSKQVPLPNYEQLSAKIGKYEALDRQDNAVNSLLNKYGTSPQGALQAYAEIEKINPNDKERVRTAYKEKLNFIEKQQKLEKSLRTKDVINGIHEMAQQNVPLEQIQRQILAIPGLDATETDKLFDIATKLTTQKEIGMGKTVNGGNEDIGTVMFLETKDNLNAGDVQYAYSQGLISGQRMITLLKGVKKEGATQIDEQNKSALKAADNLLVENFINSDDLREARTALDREISTNGLKGAAVEKAAADIVASGAENIKIKNQESVYANSTLTQLKEWFGSVIGQGLFASYPGKSVAEIQSIAQGLGQFTDPQMKYLAFYCAGHGQPITMENMKAVANSGIDAEAYFNTHNND